MKIYREVKCSDRLPKVTGVYHTNLGTYQFRESIGKFCEHIDLESNSGYAKEIYHPNVIYWLEVVDVELDSEDILPVEDRIVNHPNWEATFLEDNGQGQLYTIENYHKTLEAAELANTLLNSELAVYRERDEIMVNKITKLEQRLIDTKQLHQEYLQQLEDEELKDADERYNEALKAYDRDTNNITMQIEEYIMSAEEFETYLKLAAYGNSDEEL